MANFDLDLNEAQEINEVYAAPSRTNDRRICICGHAVSRHTHTKFNWVCKPGALSCPCVEPRPVVRVPNTRYFMRKSIGSGVKHALVRGVAASIEALGKEEFEQNSEWLVPEQCDVCQKPTGLYPVRLSNGPMLFPLDDEAEDQGVTGFLCAECRTPSPVVSAVEDLPAVAE